MFMSPRTPERDRLDSLEIDATSDAALLLKLQKLVPGMRVDTGAKKTASLVQS
jgi:hypothetical protein